ncbi:MAG TPA: CehA/McbA family metallohydrolase, partial [Chthoniobacteraceae bacterium]|nr:CehA/McbA family metallohydrolase [Chthoniobacteraceae bacterium]
RHGDATIDERMLTLAGEGIELPIATDHNTHIDYRDAMRRTATGRWFTPVIGNEVTTRVGHFNIFPVTPDASPPDANLTDWPQLLEAMRRTPGVRVIVLNHPRSIHSGFRPFDPENFNSVAGEARKSLAFGFDALEVLNSGAQQTDFMRVYRDWFALLNRGHRIVAVSGSDAHDVSRFIVGQGRTYIAAADNDPAHIDVDNACKNLREGRAFVSMGLLVNLTVNRRFSVGDLVTDQEPVLSVEAEVRGPSWIKGPTHVALFANGTQIRETDFLKAIAGPNSAGGLKGRVAWPIPRPRHDIHLVAIATAPAVDEPFWAMTKPYQPNSIHWQGRAIGSTNPVWIDGDGDGKFSSARAYAERVVVADTTSIKGMLSLLAEYDEAVAIQAASICQIRGMDLAAPAFVSALENAPLAVKNGFVQVRDATKH